MLGNVRGGIVDPFHPTMTGSNASEPVDVDAQEPIVLVLARYPGGGGSTIESDPSLGQLLGQIRQVSEAFGGRRQREGSFSRNVEPAGDPLSHRPTSVGIGSCIASARWINCICRARDRAMFASSWRSACSN